MLIASDSFVLSGNPLLIIRVEDTKKQLLLVRKLCTELASG